MQVLGREGILAIHLARRARFGGHPVERDSALTARALEHDHDHGRSRCGEAAPAHLPPIGRYYAARFGVPERQAGVARLDRAGGPQDDAPDRVARPVVHHIGAVDGPAECAVACVDRRAETTVTDEGAFAPALGQAAPHQVVAREKPGPVDPRGRLQREQRREARCQDHDPGAPSMVATTAVVHSPWLFLYAPRIHTSSVR